MNTTTNIHSPKNKLPEVREVWNSRDQNVWEQALERYWAFIMPSNLALEKEMQQLDPNVVRAMDAQTWYRFLLERYFRWKYTAANRYATTTKSLRSFESPPFISILHGTKERLFSLDRGNIKQCLTVASSIGGLGIAGASGLLAVIFPEDFGTVDQFAVKALRQIPDLPEKDRVAAMNPESLKAEEGVVLIQIMRRKAGELNQLFSTTRWTPRKIDMILWTYGHGGC